MIALWLSLACADPPPPPPVAEAPQQAKPEVQLGEQLALRVDMLEALRQKLGSDYAVDPPGLATANAEAGRALYLTHCASCHGENGRGGPEAANLSPRPSDLTHPGKSSFFSEAGRVEIIRTGFTGSAMQGYAVGQGSGADLSEAQILDVYAYVRGLRRAPQPGREIRERPPQ